MIGDTFTLRTEEEFKTGGVSSDGSVGFARANVRAKVEGVLWYVGAPVTVTDNRYYDGRNENERGVLMQVAMDHLVNDQLLDTDEKRENLRRNFRMAAHAYYKLEQKRLRDDLVDFRALEPWGSYPWFMWKKAHCNRVFQTEVHQKKHNRGINKELCVIKIPPKYVSNMKQGDRYIEGVSCYTVYVKGIPFDFHESTFIKKVLEHEPLAGFFLERDDEDEKLTGIVYVKFKYPCSVEELINDWNEQVCYDANHRQILKALRVTVDDKPRVIFATYSHVEMIIPGHPDHHRDQKTKDHEVTQWVIHLAFKASPRYAGEFTKEMLRAKLALEQAGSCGTLFGERVGSDRVNEIRSC